MSGSESVQNEDPLITFPDGDIIIKSSDGVAFRLDSLILRRSSPVFAAMFSPSTLQPTSTGYVINEWIDLPESSDVLDTVFKCIYPPNTLPYIASTDFSLDLWRAIVKYELGNQSLVGEVDYYLTNLNPPLEAWAISVRAEHEGMRASAASRFLRKNDDFLDEKFEMFEGIDVITVLTLQRLRRDVHTHMSVVLEATNNTFWYCTKHRQAKGAASGNAWESLHVRLRPPGPPLSTKCEGCTSLRASSRADTLREQAKDYLDSLLDAAIAIDAAGGYGNAPGLPVPSVEIDALKG
ncbi:hypothetical protein DL93DRAFT_2230402 [Clavulina sp. PMI_390]|nr:hypothetical protein DL93DRAFT_2230402 [Clavulina sp. PMI_390]